MSEDELKRAVLEGDSIRFLAVEWREDWEFDHPTVLLEPVFRYSPDGTDLESMIEDAAIDVAVAVELGQSIETEMSETTAKEFKWRNWSLKNIRKLAEGQKIKLGTGYVGVRERHFRFRNSGKDGIEFVDATGLIEEDW